VLSTMCNSCTHSIHTLADLCTSSGSCVLQLLAGRKGGSAADGSGAAAAGATFALGGHVDV